MKINKIISPKNTPNFKGYQHVRTNEGTPGLKFNYTYDNSQWDCAVEFYKVGRDGADYSYHLKKQNGNPTPFMTVPLDYNGTVVETDSNGLNLKEYKILIKVKETIKHLKNKIKYKIKIPIIDIPSNQIIIFKIKLLNNDLSNTSL